MVTNMLISVATLFSMQWGLQNTGDPQRIAIDHYTSGQLAGIAGEDIRLPITPFISHKKIVVAVLDTGIDPTHPLLKDRLAGKGFNAIANNDDTTDNHGHGTHVAGIIAAALNEPNGFRGVTQNAVILPIKVVQNGPNAPIRPQEVEPGAGTALTENVAKGIVWAIQNGARVINLSLAWPYSIRSKKMDDAIKLAIEKDVIIVASSGNDSTLANVYPCIYSSVVCVGAHGPDGSIAYFSNFGPMVDIVAPGVSIVSTWPMSKAPSTFAGQVGYEFRNGTSMAAPMVAGAIAELLSRGYNAEETKNRLFLGSRPTRTESLFSAGVRGKYSADLTVTQKFSAYGTLDVAQAIAVNPQPFIHPAKKSPLDLSWDGSPGSITANIEWKNSWITSGPIDIQIEGKTHHFASIQKNESVTTPVTLNLGPKTPSFFYIDTKVKDRSFKVPVYLKRLIQPNKLPSNALITEVDDLDENYGLIRTVVTNDPESQTPRLDLLAISGTNKRLTFQLVQGDHALSKTVIEGFSIDQFLNPYRLPDRSYCLIFTDKDSEQRPVYKLKFFDPHFKFTRELEIGTEITAFSENFKWIKSGGLYQPIWISIGYTPNADRPAYDPWNPKYKDIKNYRVYFVSGKEIRTLKLEDKQLPLQVLSDGKILLAEGFGYSVEYKKIALQDGKIISSEPIHLGQFRMLIGLESAKPVLQLDGQKNHEVSISGPSTPGNLRVTTLDLESARNTEDGFLYRASPLESLLQTIGVFSEQAGKSYFIASHYDLKFFKLGANETLSTSLNRYSYIPSMIFGRNFYPLVVQDQVGTRYPAVYQAASLANADVSELIVADWDKKQLVRPALYRIQSQGCLALGNFIQANLESPAMLVFVCGKKIVKLPLTIQK